MGVSNCITFMVSFFLLFCAKTKANGVYVKADPMVIIPGLTEMFTVNCSFAPRNQSDMTSLISLILSRSIGQNTANRYQELVSTNVSSSDHVNNVSETNATAHGCISNKEPSFLALQWQNPSELQAAVFRCEAHGVDNTGHPIVLRDTVDVDVQLPGTDSLVEKIGSLSTQLHTVLSKLTMLEDRMKILETIHKSSVLQLQSFDSTMQNILDGLRTSAFYDMSGDYWGSRYVAAKYTGMGIEIDEFMCRLHGGYLVEIDDANEYAFIKNYLNHLGDIKAIPILTGTTDFGHEGHYTFRFSENVTNYLPWARGYHEPNGGSRQNCVIVYGLSSWLMYDVECHRDIDAFLCEIPV